MNKVNNATQKRAPKLIDELEAEAAAQDKPFMVYLAEQSDGLRKMFIRWHKKDIEHLENIQSIYK
jgi:hypothetical protein